MLLPAYTLLLGLIALLGYMAYAAGVRPATANEVVPALFKALFPGWFAGFAFAAIAIGALVPAAVMSIGAANLFTRNFWKAYVNPADQPGRGGGRGQGGVRLVVKLGALGFVLFLDNSIALNLQLLGGLWILQTFPAVVFGLFTRWFTAPALLAGWAVGFFGGTLVAWTDGLKPLHTLAFGGSSVTLYIGVIALVVNVAVAVVVNAVVVAVRPRVAA